MENNQLNGPEAFFPKAQGKDTKEQAGTQGFEAADLNNPDVWVKHLEQLGAGDEGAGEGKCNPFPYEVFPETVQEIVLATNERLNFPVDFIGTSLLYAAAVAIGNTHRAELMRGWRESAVLYLALVGRPGTNKTHPLKWALAPLEKQDNKAFLEYERKMQEFEQVAALTKKERETQGYDTPVKPVWRQILVSDFTPEALATVHRYNKRGLGVYADELASWFNNFNRYNKGSEEQFWLSVWSGNGVKVNRKTSEPLNIALPFIGVTGTIQPGVLNKLAENRTENGFLDRLLFVINEALKKEYWSENELPHEIAENWEAVITAILNQPLSTDEAGTLQPQILRFAPDAKNRLFEFNKELTDLSNHTQSDVYRGTLAKVESYAIRFSLILEILAYACGQSDKGEIGLQSVEGALKLVEYFKNTAKRVQAIVMNENPLESMPNDKRTLYEALPDEFKTADAVNIGERLGMKERSVKRFLKEKGLFSKIQWGVYEKQI